MNLGTAITLLIVGIMLFFALRSIVRDYRSDSSNCAECGGACGKTSCSACDMADKLARDFDSASKTS